jgi:hypothetical protein
MRASGTGVPRPPAGQTPANRPSVPGRDCHCYAVGDGEPSLVSVKPPRGERVPVSLNGPLWVTTDTAVTAVSSATREQRHGEGEPVTRLCMVVVTQPLTGACLRKSCSSYGLTCAVLPGRVSLCPAWMVGVP